MPSPIDELYFRIFNSYPKKDGEAYERLATIARKLLSPDTSVLHDQNIRGIFSDTVYQLDVKEDGASGAKFGEAKDYTEKARKVGRGDLQKLGGALGDLPVASGMVFSATNFTKPAIKYAKTAVDIVGKPIELYHLRPSNAQDLDGRLMEFDVEINIQYPAYASDSFKPILTEESKARARKFESDNQKKLTTNIAKIYNSTGVLILTLQALTNQNLGGSTEHPAKGCFPTPSGYLETQDGLIEIHGIEYEVQVKIRTQRMIIKLEGEPTLIIQGEDGNIDKIITDKELRKFKFDDNGAVIC